jgi:transcriptional regulator with XRE-family HTH domain
MDRKDMDRAQLADFLRRRREALQPDDVGLAKGLRRRVAGLRREEVAGLSAMSVDYYARLEQGRGPQPSEQMVASIARGLRLTLDERDHLFRLAGHGAPARVLRSEHVSPALMRVLDRLDDTPAMVVSDLGETLAQNRLAAALLGDQSRFRGPARSAVYRWFTDPEERRLYPEADHDHQSRVQVSNLRASVTRGGLDARAASIVGRLREGSREFARLWDRHEVAVRFDDHKTIVHPDLGDIELDCQILFTQNQAQALLVFTAQPGTEGHEKLQLLSVIGTQQLGPDPKDRDLRPR